MKLAAVTLLYDPSYLPGSLVLGVALRKLVSSSALEVELAILIDESKFTKYQLDLLLELYDTLIPVQTLTSTLEDKLENDLGRPELAKTFTKVALWGLSRYDKVLYLDSDTVPEWHAKGDSTVLDLFKLKFPQNKILAVPDSGFPDIFNSGVFVLQPNITDYEQLIGLIIDSELTGKSISFDGADQGLLNQYFNPQPNWVTDLLNDDDNVQESTSTKSKSFSEKDVANAEVVKSSNWIKLPFLYNVTPSSQYEYLPAYKYFTEGVGGSGEDYGIDGEPLTGGFAGAGKDELLSSTNAALNSYNFTASNYFKGGNQIKLTHFIGPYKPWFTETKHPLHQKWWDLWENYYGKTSSIDAIAFWEKALGDHSNNTSELYYAKGKEAGKRLGNVHNVEEGTETVEESHADSEPYQEISQPSVSDPDSLCDPTSYQLLPSNIEPTEDSSWDATKEEPPKASDTPKEAPVQMEEEMRSFQNIWDGNADEEHKEVESKSVEELIEEEEEEEQAAAEPEPVTAEIYKPTPRPEIVPIPATNEREYFEPERVFYDDPVEFPTILQKVRDLEVEQDEEENALDEEEEENIADIEEEDWEEQGEELGHGPVHNYNKIFPWEFRGRSAQPERSFDDSYD
ncbi:hypothetical protein CLIB1423_21S01948 [[Candida] railenensis]|uniref:Glycogenin glucosyltransferase n=1 Tax=[Candida] railenensis TaxID=45579 RepID=A0A9P0QUY6_9ASCO|nr:hypothetical protein CLIB1423_21S01948 [[Candida] railenensis]